MTPINSGDIVTMNINCGSGVAGRHVIVRPRMYMISESNIGDKKHKENYISIVHCRSAKIEQYWTVMS